MFLESVRHASIVSLLGLLVGVAPLVMGIVFAIYPNERRLALMRPLSLAAIFATVCGLLVGVANAVYALTTVPALDVEAFRFTAVGLLESLVLVFVPFACLTVAWLSVAIGMRRLFWPG